MTLARRNTAIEKAADSSADWVPHISLDDVRGLASAALNAGREGKGDRDSLLIQTMFDGCLRVSEALQLTPNSLHQTEYGWAVWITGKGNKRAEAAISTSLASRLHAYAYQRSIPPTQRFFRMDRKRVHKIMERAFDAAGIIKPPHVGAVHVLRHSGLIERLEATGNPKAVQDQARHQSFKMTQRYMKTVSSKHSLRINQGVDFQW